MKVAEGPLIMMVVGDPFRFAAGLFDPRAASTRVSTLQT